MAGGKKMPQFALVIGSPVSPQNALAQVIVTTAATYAMEHFEEFEEWLKQMHADHEMEIEEPITKATLTASIARVIFDLPEKI